MALWTPYAEALDLRTAKSASKAKVKQEKPEAFPLRQYQCLPPSHSPDLRQYPFVPVPQISPDLRQYPFVPVPQISPDVTSWYTKSVTPPESEYESESLLDDVEYQAFERDALRAMAERNGGSLLGNNPRMRRAVQGSAGDDGDEAYRRQRERNNHAAKQSRDRRKLREMRLAFQVTFLRKKLTGLRARLSERVCTRCQQLCRC